MGGAAAGARTAGEGESRKRRPQPSAALVAAVREALGEEWLPRLYRERVLPQRTRAHELPAAGKRERVEVQHTLLGVELKVGRRRLSCPDLATARYLSVFARAGCPRAAVPYDITKISPLADQLESAWHRMLLQADSLTEGKSAAYRARARGAVVAEAGRELEEAGAGARVPQFRQETRQRAPRRI